MNKQEITYFVYVRKSSEPEGRQVLSIPAQLADINSLVARKQLNVVDTIIDARSAKIPNNRPSYTKMISSIKKGKANGVIVWHTDRLARNALEWGEIQYLLQSGVIKSIWTMHREYLSKDNILLMSLEAGMATQYSIDLSEKVKNGLKQKCEQGQPSGFAQLGYLNTKLAAHGTNSFIVDPDRWHIVRKGFDLMLSKRYTVSQIADILNNDYGLRTRVTKKNGGKPVHKSILYRIFTDPLYSGYFNYGGKTYKGSYKPMITVAEFDQIQEILGRKGKPKQQKHKFAFTGLIKCESCGCAITATMTTKKIKTTGEIKTYTFYHCTKKRGRDICTEKHYTKKEDIEEMIESEISAYDLDEDFKTLAIQILQADQQFEVQRQEMLYKDVIAQEQKLIKEIDNLLDLRISNVITEDKYLEKQQEREAQLIRARDKKDQMERGIENGFSSASNIISFATNAVERFKNNGIDEQKSICHGFGHNWVLKDKKLIIDKPKWFFAIKTFKDNVSSELSTSQPRITFEKYRQKASFESSNLALRRM
ncbi:MAG: recombinase family protein [Gammaproteobacteria bacterium]|nr:recombinase family protein [Gammaproteobacteria bacterium]